MEFRQIPLSDIDQNFKYAYRSKFTNSDWLASIKNNGILEPVWLVNGQPFQLLEGHQRILAATELNIALIPALIFPASYLSEVFCRALHLNLNRGLTLPEKLRAFIKIENVFDQQTIQKIQAILGLNHHPTLPGILNYVKNSPEWLFEYLRRINIQFKNLKRLADYPLHTYENWLGLSAELHLKAVEMISLLENLQDISLRDAVTPGQIWQQSEIDAIRDAGLTPQQKVREIKERLAHLRAPLFHKTNDSISDSAKHLEKYFRGNLQVRWDRSMEMPGISLLLKCTDSDQVESQLKLFGKKVVIEQIKTTIDLMEKIPEEKFNDQS